MNGNSRVAQHRFGPRGGDAHELRLARLGIDDRIAAGARSARRRFRESLRRR